MHLVKLLLGTVILLFVLNDLDARKSSARRSGRNRSGVGSRSTSRTTPRPRQTQQSSQNRYQQTNTQNTQHGSTPDKIGWNVPNSNNKQTGSKPSAPLPEQNIASKTSATSLQSGYNPSGGYPRQPASNPYGSQSGSNPYSNTGQGYNPSAGHGYNPSVGQGYNPSAGHGYNPSAGHGYNPSAGHGYNPPAGGHIPHGQSYNPSIGNSYNPGGQPYNPSFGQSYNPSFGQVPQQTILMQSAPAKGPGIGQLAKEAFVFAGVSAGVNAAVNRIIPGGIYGHRESGGGGGGGGGGGTHTEITYNNYYNNGTAPSQGEAANVAAPAPAVNNAPNAAAPNPPPSQPAAAAAESAQTSQVNPINNASPNSDPKPNSPNSQEASQNNPNPLGYVISNDDIKKLTEELFAKDKNNANNHITINLQGQKKDDSTTDDAPLPLLTVKPEAYEIPTVKAVLNLYDNYELDVKTKEDVTSEERREESELLDKFLETDVLVQAMKFLASKGYIPDDIYEFKDALKRIWFSQFKRIDGDASSSGFETVYLAEKFDSDIIGLHNWIYYAKQEEEKHLNYLGYIKEVKLGDKGAILKVRSSLNDIVQPVTTLFVGTSPELEMALYTVCFFTRPSNVCPISLGGSEFMIIASRVNYFGKDILVSGYPEI